MNNITQCPFCNRELRLLRISSGYGASVCNKYDCTIFNHYRFSYCKNNGSYISIVEIENKYYQLMGKDGATKILINKMNKFYPICEINKYFSPELNNYINFTTELVNKFLKLKSFA